MTGTLQSRSRTTFSSLRNFRPAAPPLARAGSSARSGPIVVWGSTPGELLNEKHGRHHAPAGTIEQGETLPVRCNLRPTSRAGACARAVESAPNSATSRSKFWRASSSSRSRAATSSDVGCGRATLAGYCPCPTGVSTGAMMAKHSHHGRCSIASASHTGLAMGSPSALRGWVRGLASLTRSTSVARVHGSPIGPGNTDLIIPHSRSSAVCVTFGRPKA